jgi:hypothetical protein
MRWGKDYVGRTVDSQVRGRQRWNWKEIFRMAQTLSLIHKVKEIVVRDEQFCKKSKMCEIHVEKVRRPWF